MVVIAGEGPKANGIPEMFYPSEYLNRDPVLRHVAALVTDGRYSGATYGPCIGHASPEALEGGAIGADPHRRPRVHGHDGPRIDVLDAERSFAGGRFQAALPRPCSAAGPSRGGRADRPGCSERRLD